MYPLRSLAGAGGRLLGRQQTRVLRIYLGATTFLYVYGVTFTLFPIRSGLSLANPAGGIAAIVLGLSALGYLAARPGKPAPATFAAIAATPSVMAFHNNMTAEYVCVIAAMFLAIYLRAFHPPGRGLALIAVLLTACLSALFIAPAPKVGLISYLIVAIAIVGAAESFGLVMRALLTASCTDPLTGLLNRAGWEIATTDLRMRRWSDQHTMTVVALDINNLKQLNDTYGHHAGDHRITTYAGHWEATAPPGAALARLGGDEFAACIVSADPGAVHEFVADARLHTPEVSIGLAAAPAAGANLAALYAQADAALYASRGRPLQSDGTTPPDGQLSGT